MRTRIKICGLTNLDDALCAASAGADLLGFIFAPESRRYVTAKQVRPIVEGVLASCRLTGQTAPRFVGVYVDEQIGRIESDLEFAGLDYAQLHGSESLAMLSDLRGRGFKAIRPDAHEWTSNALQAEAFAAAGVHDGPRLLVDAYSPDAHGGTGRLADWRHAAVLARRVDGLMLAGGLTPDNVAAAIATVHPWGVDVSSGVERRPGRKDHAKIQRLITAVCAADARGRHTTRFHPMRSRRFSHSLLARIYSYLPVT